MVYKESLGRIAPGATVTILCKALESPYKTGSVREVYEASVGYEKILLKGIFTHGFQRGCYYEVNGKYGVSKAKKEIDVFDYTLSYPTDDTSVGLVLSRLCSDSQLSDDLVEVCGERVLFMLEKELNRIKSMKDWSAVDLDEIRRINSIFMKRREKESAVRLLLMYNIPPSEIIRIMKSHSLADILALETEPYELIEMTYLAEFRNVDKIALTNGYPLKGTGRLMAIILYSIQCAVSQYGHTLSTKQQVLEDFEKAICIPLGLTEAKNLLKKGETTDDAPRKVVVGDQEFVINIVELRIFFNKWNAEDKKTRGDFRFPLLKIEESLKLELFDTLVSREKIHIFVWDGSEFYQLDKYYRYELESAMRLHKIIRSDKSPYADENIRKALAMVLNKLSKEIGGSIELEPEQESAILGICSTPYGVSILTGPAGSGKTFVLKIIIQVLTILRSHHKDLAVTSQVLAPTGRAAQVATKAIGQQSSTIHRHFGISPDTEEVNTDHDDTLNIVDEFSMVDTALLAKMLSGLNGVSKLVFVGDPEQLSSIESGSCLRDLIASKVIPHYHLKTAKRQSARSGILINANKIIAGESISSVIINESSALDNSYIIPCKKNADVLEKLSVFINGVGLERFHKDLVQILCSTKGDETGVNALNLLAQSLLNPYTENKELSEGKGYDRVKSVDEHKGKPIYIQAGDKVINTVNSYSLGVYEQNEFGEYITRVKSGIMNGEMGVVIKVYRTRIADKMTRRVIVKFPEGYVLYDGPNIANLSLAYAITIHKSQGSQWPIVLSPLIKYSERMHTRNLLYTMFTRAETTCYLLGDSKSIESCIQNPSWNKRNTGLKQMLRRQFFPEKGETS